MSGTPKKTHEEAGGHSSSSSKYFQDETGTVFPNLGRKVTSPVATEYHAPIEMGPEAWLSKIPRIDSRDAGKKSPLHSIYRMPLPSSNDPHLDNIISATESRLDSRDPKDNKEPPKGIENREPKVEARDLDSEAKRDSLNSKGEKDERLESRGVDGKQIKHNWDPHQSYAKDLREYNRGFFDKTFTPFSSMAGPVEGVKDSLPTDEKDYIEVREAVGENRIDDRFKEKDRKRKDGKHRERGDRRSLPLGSNYNEGKELIREDREAERWGSERNDFPKEKERVKEREGEHNKRESLNVVEKEATPGEKDLGDGSFKNLERENLTSEQKRHKDSDGWKNLDRDAVDVKKERDVDAEGERPEKRSRYSDKDTDEGCAEAEGGTEKEKEASNYGVQQRKRMLRPRGSPLSNHEPRYKPRSLENEGSQGKPDVSTVVYKVGECMQELMKLWKEYKADKKSESSESGPTLEIRIPAEYVTATNRQVRGGQLWGTDIYTDDSDLVAVLMHTGYCRPTASLPPPSIQELGATIRVLPPQDCYVSTLRNNVRSRAWGAAIGCSYRVERCCIVKKGGGTIDLEPCLTHTSTVEPTLAPVAVERTMTTRAAASNALRQQRFVREVTIQYNLCNEPWIKYSISIVADKGLKKPMYTSARLKKGEVLYLETHSQRYELCFSGEKMIKPLVSSQVHETEAEKSQNHHLQTQNGERSLAESENVIFDAFRWSRSKKPLPQKVMRSVGIPLPLDYVEVLEENIDWEDIRWSQSGVCIAKKEYALARVHFLSLN